MTAYERDRLERTLTDLVEEEVRAYFAEAAGVKLDDDGKGWLFDGDSNWGFEPRVLAAKIVRVLERKVPNLGVSEPDK